MLFGAKSRFGIECELKSFTEPQQPIWGSIWIWADGQRLGEEASHVDVGLVAVALCASLLYRNRRRDERLVGKDKEEIWSRVFGTLYGESEDRPADAMLRDSDQFHKFPICGAMEGFDNVLGVLVENSKEARFIWRSYAWTDQARAVVDKESDKRVHEVILRPGEYESVVESFLDWLERETGFRPEIKDWVELSEEERETIRREIIKRKPGLARADRRSQLEGAAMKELAQERMRETLNRKGNRALRETGTGPA